MKNFKIYLAGGITSLSVTESSAWRYMVSHMLKNRCNDRGVKYNLELINPCNYFSLELKNYSSELEVMNYLVRHVKSSDLILVNFNDPKSIGTAQEIALAYDRGIPVIGVNIDDVELNPWLVCCCDRIFDNFQDTVDYILEFYLT